MENASKALIMAGSVLIALLIIGALILMFNNLSNYQKVGDQGTKEAQIVEFNNQYETFNRKNIRGNDIYSLLNRVIDYNRRKSTKGTGDNDEGQYLAYEPITMIIDFAGKNNEFSADNTTARLIKVSRYEQSANTNEFENGLKRGIEEAEKKLRRRNSSKKFSNWYDKNLFRYQKSYQR